MIGWAMAHLAHHTKPALILKALFLNKPYRPLVLMSHILQCTTHKVMAWWNIFIDLSYSYSDYYVEKDVDWEKHLPLVLFAYRTVIHSLTGTSPFC